MSKVNGRVDFNGFQRLRKDTRPVLITGGAGFIGANVADRLLSAGREVILLDNMSRAGVDLNALWLQQRHGRRLRVIIGDVRDPGDLKRALTGVCHVFHLAAQVAVTTSLEDPRTDFEVNAGGTLNLLEQMRAQPVPPSIIYSSTNKVYGGLADIAVGNRGLRYEPADREIVAHGIAESRPLAFHTPYGCSKGAAEQYVLDYSRSFGIPAVVFRLSCTYGPHQFGTEDQGWVAHFLARAADNKEITIYGDGMQVRDILFIDDLVEAFLGAWNAIDTLSGNAFNVGGGVEHAISLLELVQLLESQTGRRLKINFARGRAGDQLYYVSDTTKLRRATGWTPATSAHDGIERLYEWLLAARRLAPAELFAS